MVMKTSYSIAALAAVMLGMPFCSVADPPPFVYNVENSWTNYPALPLPPFGSINLPSVQPLPDPFMWLSAYTNRTFNSRSTNFVDWEHHRNEIAALIQNYEIGPKPAVDIPSQVTASYSGGTTPGTSGTLIVHVTVNGHTLGLTNAISIPAAATAPYPVCIGMNNSYGSLPDSDFTSRGIASVTYFHNQVTTYGSPSLSNPYYQLYGGSPYNFNLSNTGQYSAWAWGVSRIIDGLTLVTNTLPVDLQHICVTGCSYAGKMALFSGAFDERVALTVAQESGGGGANSWRYNHTESAGSVEDTDNTDYNWFANQLQQFSGDSVWTLPDDHHELDAMVAPRALYVTGNTGFTWLGNPSCYVCSRAAQQIYQTLGIADRFGFNIDGGHDHCAFPSDQTNDLAYFLDKFMLGQTNLSSNIATYPGTYAASIDYARWTAWWGTTNPAFPYVGQLSLSAPNVATEGDGTLAGAALVSVKPTPTNNFVTVYLTSGNTNKVIVPDSVVIPVGQSNAVFDLTILDNSLLDGDQSALISASSPVCNNNPQSRLIIVHDNETVTLSVALPASASESAGTLVNAGSISIETPVAANIPVSLASSDPSRLIVPATTTLSTGQTSAVFNLTLVTNNIIEGPQIVGVTAHVPNWTDGSNSMTILNATPLPDHYAWAAVPSPQTVGGPFPVTITAQDSADNPLDFQLPVALSGLMPGNAPATNTLLNSASAAQSDFDGYEYTLGYSFTPNADLEVTQVRAYFGDKVSIWSASGQLLGSQAVVSVPGTWVDTPLPAPLVLHAGATYVITTHDNGVQYYWNPSLPTTFANGTINQSWSDNGDVFPRYQDSFYWYLVDLRYGTNITSVTVNPPSTGNFTNGVWSGKVAVLQAGTNVMLQASAGAGNGISNPFNVIAKPALAITNLNNSVVLSWPVAANGFNLEQSSTMSGWTNVPVTPAVVGDRNYVTNALDSARTYYRLRKP